MTDFCNANCRGECPDEIMCPYDSNVETHGKNRSLARKRSHSRRRARKSAEKNSIILKSKADKIPESAPSFQHSRAEQRIRGQRKKCKV